MSQDRIEIYGIPQSNFTRAVRMVCAEKAIDYDHFPVHPHSGEASAIHPLGKVPGLRHGQVRLGESRAIVAYLDRLHPQTPMMPASPEAPTAEAEAEQWVSIVMTVMDPVLIRQYVFANLFPKTADGTVDRATVDAALPELKAFIVLLDGALAGKDFLAAARFTFADALLLSTLAAVRLFSEGAQAIAGAPHLARYLQLHSSRASFIATDPWHATMGGNA